MVLSQHDRSMGFIQMMMNDNFRSGFSKSADSMPVWVPQSVRNYLAHTEGGTSIRELAREDGCHASTVLRQVRKLETRRDDPLVDAALRTLGAYQRAASGIDAVQNQGSTPMANGSFDAPLTDAQTLAREGARVLRRLCEKGALLAVAENMEKAVVVRDGAAGASTRTGVVDRVVAEAMALKGWIATKESGTVSRYRITSAGRAALADLLARAESRKATEGADDAHGYELAEVAQSAQAQPRKRSRYTTVESPLIALARRRDRDGAAFLSPDLVHAGEQLREDFELAQMSPVAPGAWESFLQAPGETTLDAEEGGASADARARMAAALNDLGPGLADVVLRCCCYLEGLEIVEKHLGWSARSGKIVLRIALMRLRRHYDETIGVGGGMIG